MSNARTECYGKFEQKGILEDPENLKGLHTIALMTGGRAQVSRAIWHAVLSPHTESFPLDEFGQVEVKSGCQKYVSWLIPYKLIVEIGFEWNLDLLSSGFIIIPASYKHVKAPQQS